MPASRRPTPDDIDIVSLFGAVRLRLRNLLVVTVVIGAATYGILSAIAPRFASEAQLSLSAKRTNPFPEKRDNPDSLAPRLDKEAINTHVRSLMAPDLIRTVTDQLGLKNRVEFNSALGSLDLWSRVLRVAGLGAPIPGETAEERVARVAYDQLEVAVAHESRFISIRFFSADPDLAARFANRLASAYRETLIATPVKETSDVVKILQPKVDQLRRELITTEAAVERFRANTDQFRSGPENTPINDRRMSALADELTRAEAAKSEVEARWSTARELARAGSADVLPEVQKSPLIQNLINQRVTLEREFSEATANLLPGHPRMRELTANLTSLKKQIDAEVRKVVTSLEKDYRAATLRAGAAAAELEKMKTKVGNTSGNEAKLRALESEARSKRAELEQLQKQLEDNRTLVNIKQVPVEAQIVSIARASSTPIFPKKGPYTLLAMAASFLLGLGWIIFRELVAGAYGSAGRSTGSKPAPAPSPPPREAHHAEPTLSPIAPAANGSTRTIAGRPQPMARIASRISEREGAANGYRTMIVGAADQPPATSVVLDLASQLTGRGQSVLVVEWHAGGTGSLSPGTGRSALGMTDLLRGDASFEDVIRELPGGTIQVIAPGAAASDDENLLEPEGLNLIFDVLDETYDQVIIAASRADAEPLFEALEGRIDAGIRISNGLPGSAAGNEPPSSFLGFEVEGIELFDYDAPPASAPEAPAKRRFPALSRSA